MGIQIYIVIPVEMLASPYHEGISLPRIPLSRGLHSRVDMYVPSQVPVSQMPMYNQFLLVDEEPTVTMSGYIPR